MKTIKLSLAAVLFIVAIAATAVERPKVNILPLKDEQALITVVNEKAAYFELGIYTANGEMVYYKQTNEQLKDYSKVYDFKNLAKGKYVLSLRINDTQVTNDFEVSGNQVKIGQKKITYDPYFSFENNELKLSYLNFEQQNLKLYIYGRNGLVYEKSLGRDFSIIKGLDLSKLEKGSYNIVLNTPGKEFSYNVVK